MSSRNPINLDADFDENLDFSEAMAALLGSVANASSAAPLVGAQNDFGTSLLTQLEAANHLRHNIIVSPSSLWQALALTASGARGETQAQLKKLLRLPSLTEEEMGKANRALIGLLTDRTGATVAVAISVWFDELFRANPAFVQTASTHFAATVDTFSGQNSARSAQKINEWVSNRTQREINRVVESGDLKGAGVLLINAVYFRARWADKFNPQQTRPETFHLADGSQIQVPMMHGRRASAYVEGQNFEGVCLKYKDSNYVFWALLPRVHKSPLNVIQELGEKAVLQLHGSETVVLSLPRFDIEWSAILTNELARMGAPLPFSSAADLSGMGASTERIDKVVQVCKMSLDEEGTVATAATAVRVAKSASRPQYRELVFNRPFVMAIVEETSGARLFVGAVHNPRATSVHRTGEL